MNWYKQSQMASPAQTGTPEQSSSGELQIARKEMQEAEKQFKDSSWIKKAAMRALLANQRPVVEYLMNPNETTQSNLVKMIITSIMTLGISRLPVLGKWVGPQIQNLVFNQTTIPQLPQMKGIVDYVTNNILPWLQKSLSVGEIPDEISNQIAYLKQYDLPDTIAADQVLLAKLRDIKKTQGPQMAMGFIQIILRLQDNMGLLQLQKSLIQ